eukprot:c20491_g1_i2.p1 GENE.c20491_g1_i2~~c20491_g1_i2.p1  ORF type:complete len:162 (+),score=15.76 c20491_g1_i2:138-623(+)
MMNHASNPPETATPAPAPAFDRDIELTEPRPLGNFEIEAGVLKTEFGEQGEGPQVRRGTVAVPGWADSRTCLRMTPDARLAWARGQKRKPATVPGVRPVISKIVHLPRSTKKIRFSRPEMKNEFTIKSFRAFLAIAFFGAMHSPPSIRELFDQKSPTGVQY